MEYTRISAVLRSVFDPEEKEMKIPGSDIKIVNIEFRSDFVPANLSGNRDKTIRENTIFSYPVFIPADPKAEKVILLLHGLNERSWLKYLTWALFLSQSTGSYVILFPISYHMNRSPQLWKDPRAMVPLLNGRKTEYGEIGMSSFANIALSNRLTEDPMRFFNSGYQTVCDIVKLMNQIKSGSHQVIPEGSRVDVFAYSIGCFLAQIIFMGDPDKLFSDSKLFMFCGGSVFSNMHGTSKLIMDSLAYNKLYSYFMKDFEKDISDKSPLVEFFHSTKLGMAFRSMIDLSRLKAFRENILKGLRKRVYTIAMANDLVIPADGIVETMKFGNRRKNLSVEIWDFPYACSHENPFPIFSSPLSDKVDESFNRLFSKASLHLA